MKLVHAITIIATITAVADARKLKRDPPHLRGKMGHQMQDTITFDDPTHHGKLVDTCLTFQTDCGKPAADAYCKEKGYGEAVKFPKRRSYKEETLTMKQHATCSPANNVCDTFAYIICSVMEQRFDDPREHGRALDGCYEFDSDCGEAAADAFCKDKGYEKASAYSEIVSEEETMTIGDHAVCDPAWHGCSAFESITCVGSGD